MANNLHYDTDAEMSLLGCLILDNKNIYEVIDIVNKEDFYRNTHSIIYSTILELFDKRVTVDIVTLKNELEKQQKLEEIGGSNYLGILVESVPNLANACAYAKVVKEKAVLRNIVDVCSRVINEANNSPQDVNELIDTAERMIFDATQNRVEQGVIKIGDILNEIFTKLVEIRDRKHRLSGLPTGFYQIDDTLAGLLPGQLIVVAGRPSMGKTSLAIRLAEYVGLELNKPVLFFSLEMSKIMIVETMLCSHCRVNLVNLRKGIISDEEKQRFMIALGKFENAPVYINDSGDLSILELRSIARRVSSEHKIELILVDYLQRLSAHDKKIENRQQEIAYISNGLKGLAKDLGIPVVAVAQLNRAPETRDDHRPRLADLRESGAIEQDADVVLLLHREEFYDPLTPKQNICEINIAKNRTGPLGQIELAFLAKYMRFENLATANLAD